MHLVRRLHARLADRFELAPGGEYSVEVDPRTVDAPAMQSLRGMGFNRVSFGVQDFDPGVQAAVHRPQSEAQTLAVIDGARRIIAVTDHPRLRELVARWESAPDQREAIDVLIVREAQDLFEGGTA